MMNIQTSTLIPLAIIRYACKDSSIFLYVEKDTGVVVDCYAQSYN